MKKMLALTKIQALNALRALSQRAGGKAKSKSYLLLLLLPLLFVPQLYLMFHSIYAVLRQAGLEVITVGIAFVFSSVFVLTMSFTSVLQTVVASKNNDALIVLPTPTRVIVFSKFFFTYLSSCAISVFLMAVPSVLYSMDHGWHHLVSFLVVALLAPAIPLAINLLIITPLARLLQNSRWRTTLLVIANLLFAAAYVGVSLLVSRSYNIGDAMQASPEMAVLTGVATAYPPTVFAIRAFRFIWLDALLYVAGSIAILYVAFLLLERMFHTVHTDEDGDRPRSVGRTAAAAAGGVADLTYSVASKSKHIYTRMFKQITSSGYMIMTVVSSTLVPFFLIGLQIMIGTISLDALRSEFLRPFVPLIVAAVALAPAVFDSMAQCAISREGTVFWENKILPISAHSYVRYYLVFHLALVFVQQLVIGVIATLVLSVPVADGLLAIAAALAISTGYIALCIFLDISSPNLRWTMIQQVVKNSKNQVIAIFGKMGFALLLAYPVTKMLGSLAASQVLLVLLGFGLLFATGATGLLLSLGVKRFERIDL